MHIPFFLRLSRMRTRTSYDTTIKHLYREGLEELIPLSTRKKIPRSTIHRWRNEHKEKYIGNELNDLHNAELQLLKKFIHSRNERRIFMTYVRMGRFLQEIAGDKLIKKLLSENKEDLIDLIERSKGNIPLEQLLRCFSLSRSTYNTWILGLYGDCYRSQLNWCKVRQPHQLSDEEIGVMKDLLSAKEFEHWPISSVAHYARRNGIMYASNSTWYKYAKILDLRRPTKRYRKRRHKSGIKAHTPNEIWHADVTYFSIGTKMYYIYLVVDNYSRKILSHEVSDQLSAKHRLKTIREAYENEFGLLYNDVTLMVDGGSENNNHLMNDFVDILPNLRKLIALKDIRFGNTQVEAHNKILKQSWLYRTEIKDGDHLKRVTKEAIREFNMDRPHDALGGLTPAEAHEQMEPYMDNLKEEKMKEARKDRCLQNKCNSCKDCPFVKEKVYFE